MYVQHGIFEDSFHHLHFDIDAKAFFSIRNILSVLYLIENYLFHQGENCFDLTYLKVILHHKEPTKVSKPNVFRFISL